MTIGIYKNSLITEQLGNNLFGFQVAYANMCSIVERQPFLCLEGDLNILPSYVAKMT